VEGKPEKLERNNFKMLYASQLDVAVPDYGVFDYGNYFWDVRGLGECIPITKL
jgi:hypothetical protein